MGSAVHRTNQRIRILLCLGLPLCIVLQWLFFVLALAVIFPDSAWAAEPPVTPSSGAVHLSSDPQVRQVRSLIENRRFDQALSILRPLLPGHPHQTDVRFLIGLAAIGAAGQAISRAHKTTLLDEAIAALRVILIDHPDLVRVRLELARAFFLKGEDGLSREHFERVLAGRPSAAIAANIQRFLQIMQARRRWRGYIGFAIAPDTNIHGTSEAEYIYINGLPFRRDADSLARSGVGTVLWGGGEYRHPLSPRWRLVSGLDIYHKEYARKRFNQTHLSTHIGPRLLMNRQTELTLLGVAQRRWTGGSVYARDWGLRLGMEHWFSPRLSLSGQTAWYQREHLKRQDTILDGPLMMLVLDAALGLTPAVRGELAVGFNRQRPQVVRWRNADVWGRLGVSAALGRGFTLGGSVALHRGDYQGNWYPFTAKGDSREDRTRIFRLSILNRAFTVFGFSPQLVLVNEVNKSNAQLYDYQRNRAELRFVRQF